MSFIHAPNAAAYYGVQRSHMSTKQQRSLLVVACVVVLAVVAFAVLRRGDGREGRAITFNNLAQRVATGDVTEIRIAEGGGLARTRSGEVLSFYVGRASVLDMLTSFGSTTAELSRVTYTVSESERAWI